ncbi:SDR family oxidoreductase [Flavicella sediminum]|uniref:SDR family oxidoreductase n=1 Tax=Flavicella sediminum TaxID=2585141 RepID=UPI00111ECDAB|nr:SDR family oxidoreductase [Flavicella sediminum]
MKILITGTTGYIAKRLIPLLLSQQHELICCVRDLLRIPENYIENPQISFLEIDFLKPFEIEKFPKNIDAAYYLIHSMSSNNTDFDSLEKTCAENFKTLIEATNIQQVIYLSGITNDIELSKHLNSRKQVAEILVSKKYALTTIKAGIIVGSGSASFEIIRDLVEKLPIMITPKWLNTKTQPIGISDVVQFLNKSLFKKELYNVSFDIYGPEILTYKKMLLIFSEVRGLKRTIITVPIMTPKLSSYWLYFVTSTSFRLAASLVDSMKIEIIGKENSVGQLLEIYPISYKTAVEKAFDTIEQNVLISSWKDSMVSGVLNQKLSKHINIPQYGCFKDVKSRNISNRESTLAKIWALGGSNGWYSMNYLWRIRGYLDKLFGGIGLRRGRTHPTKLQTGDALDFWRVIYANKNEGRLLLYAEMKLPGEAWLEFKIVKNKLFQRAVFRPKGLWGRLYWYSVLPFHSFIFKGLIRKLIS